MNVLDNINFTILPQNNKRRNTLLISSLQVNNAFIKMNKSIINNKLPNNHPKENQKSRRRLWGYVSTNL